MRVPNILKRFERRLSPARDSRGRGPGQSLAEFALVLPVFMLIVLIGLDFGRVYSGWVVLQQASRIAADFAAQQPNGWQGAGSLIVKEKYQELVRHETQGINCDLPDPAPDPVFHDTDGDGLFEPGETVTVQLDCTFHLLTPFLADVMHPSTDPAYGTIPTTAHATFPVKYGLIDNGAGGGSGCAQTGTCPQGAVARFSTLPVQNPLPTTHITSGQSVQFIDSSSNQPTSWTWDFGDGSATVPDEFPIHAYTNPGSSSVTNTVRLTACNLAGCTTALGYVVVQGATPAPVAAFHWCTSSPCNNPVSPTPLTGPITVNFFDDSTNTPDTWAWTFGDGGTASTQNPSHDYASVSSSTVYTITLIATNGNGSNQIQHTITVNPVVCTRQVPTFTGNDPLVGGAGKWKTADVTSVWTMTAAQYNAAHGTNFSWTGGGFTGSIIYNGSTPGSATQFRIDAQTPAAGPSQLCSSTLTLTWH